MTKHRAGGLALRVALILVLGTAVAFAPVLDGGFTNFDDDQYVTVNDHVRHGMSLAGIRWALTATEAANWHPLTWISHMLDVEVWRLDPRGHHGTSLLIHLANAVLLFLVFRSATEAIRPSALVAALFAVHPLHVESVAWIAERKDLLSTLFGLLALAAYLRWTRATGVGAYVAVLAAFAASLASKPMWVTLPFLLLLLDVWPLGRLRGLGEGAARVREKLPLFALSAAISGVTLWVQRRGGALGSLESYSADSRIVNAAISYLHYLRKTLWPVDLAAFYPRVQREFSDPQTVAALALLLAVSVLAYRERHRRPWFLVGWCWYLGMLVPVIGLVQVGEQAMADRYTYVPLVGIFVIVAWGLAEGLAALPRSRAARSCAFAAVGLALAASAIASHRQTKVWHDTETLFTHALAVTRNNHVAHINLGLARSAAGDLPAALEHYSRAVAIHDGSAVAHNNLGAVLDSSGRRAEAIVHYRRAIAIDSEYVQAMRNLGLALFAERRLDEAGQWIGAAARRLPDDEAAQYEWGTVLAHSGEWDGAIARFRDALALRPEHADAHYNLALALHYRGEAADAWAELELAERLGYEPAPAVVQMLRGRFPKARLGDGNVGSSR